MPHAIKNEHTDIYSSTGFDSLGVLVSFCLDDVTLTRAAFSYTAQ